MTWVRDKSTGNYSKGGKTVYKNSSTSSMRWLVKEPKYRYFLNLYDAKEYAEHGRVKNDYQLIDFDYHLTYRCGDDEITVDKSEIDLYFDFYKCECWSNPCRCRDNVFASVKCIQCDEEHKFILPIY